MFLAAFTNSKFHISQSLHFIYVYFPWLDDDEQLHYKSLLTHLKTMAQETAVTTIDLEGCGLEKVASGKVREIFEMDSETLLFVATDRISAYDVILANVSALYYYI